MNNVLTASRMNALMRCARYHFWNNEIGLRKDGTGLALRIGSAWARAMEARWHGLEYEQALGFAIPEGIELDAYSCAIVAALLAGYYDYYGPIENIAKLNPEVQFQSKLEGTEFTSEGKMDGLGSMDDGRSVLLEAKTTGDSLAPDSDFWLRLTFNLQVLNYITEARLLGWDVAEVFYDVTRKPTIRPKVVNNLDSNGKKIVLDQNGKRVTILSGKNKGKPREGGDSKKGYELKTHIETPDEFSDRLWRDTLARPDFYFVRRSIPILEDELEKFRRHRLSLAKVIAHYRSEEQGVNDIIYADGHENEMERFSPMRDPEAWPRNVAKDNCNFCSYKSFCLQNISIDINNPPAGFSIQPFNQELEYDTTTTEDTADTSAS